METWRTAEDLATSWLHNLHNVTRMRLNYSAHARHVPQFCSFRYRQHFLSLQQGREYNNGHV